MAKIKLYWNPTYGSENQTLKYRVLGSTVWTDVSLPTFINTYELDNLVDNQMYELLISNICNEEIVVSSIVKKFTASELSWSFTTLSTNSIKAEWNFQSSTNFNTINLSIYSGNTLISNINIPKTNTGFYIFTGLNANTAYTIVYGLTYTEDMTFTEENYEPGVGFLTPSETLLKYKRTINVSTF